MRSGPTDRRGRRGLAGAVALSAVLLLAPAPALAGGPPAPVPVGGPLLGRHDTAVLPQPATPPVPAGVTASGWLLADLHSGDVLAAHDAHGRFAPASTLKTLTALALIPRLNPARVVTASDTDVDVVGSKVGLVPRQRYRVQQLFTALLVVSGNDAANTLAAAAGGASSTVALMNTEAARLGASDTAARNVTGLDAPGQVTSAYDLALIARAGMRLPAFRSYVAVRRSFMPGRGGRRFEIGNHNRLLYNYPGAIGIKNGYTVAAGATFVGAARRGDRTLVVTLLNASPRVWHEAAALLDWGFAAGDRLTPVGRLIEPPVAGRPSAAPLGGGQVPVASAPRAAGPASQRAPAGTGRSRELLAVVALLVGVGALVRRWRTSALR